MKKRKLIYFLSIAPLALSLASCGDTRDYFAKDFDFEIPEKDSKATVEYDLENAEKRNEADEKMKQAIDKAHADFYNTYSAIMLTERNYEYYNEALDTITERKFIIDFKNKSLYNYIHFYTLDYGELSSDCSIETKAYLADSDTFRVDTEITLDNYRYGTRKSSKYATGSKKITTLHKNSEDVFNYKTRLDFNDFDINHGIYLEVDNILYTTEDFNYWYCTNYTNFGEPFLTRIAENGLPTYYSNIYYYGYEEDRTDIVKRKTVFEQKYEYFTHSILNTKYDNAGYLEYDEKLLYLMGGQPSFIHTGTEALTALLYSDVCPTWFTVTEAN